MAENTEPKSNQDELFGIAKKLNRQLADMAFPDHMALMNMLGAAFTQRQQRLQWELAKAQEEAQLDRRTGPRIVVPGSPN